MDDNEKAFNDLKSYLGSPPLLVTPNHGDVFKLYLAISNDAESSVLVKYEGK